ncbi:DUF3482 domain-containing protein [bacterium]|nr:DUF3482 domain-containing protein [bacterium]
MTTSSQPPVFVVVGHVNRGKSSIVSTLAADESVRIDATPGTTRQCRSYPMRLNGQTLYVLVDTPGFERARHMLAWLRERETSTADRRALVRRFVDEHARSGQFEQEIELLRPILDGGAILYVVDGSIPFNPGHEAEMEILRWTAQPRMALINPIGPADHISQWRAVLDQYFSLVRVFNAHRADFEQRVRLLKTLRELSDEWRPAIEHAIEALREGRRHDRRESAGVIADMMADMLGLVEEKRLEVGEDVEPKKRELSQKFRDRLRRREQAARQAILQIYAHERLEVMESDLEPVGADLFDMSTWSRLGLSRGQLAATSAAMGAAVGGSIDFMVAGHSFMLGTVIGGAVGAASSWLAWDRLTQVRVLGQTLGGPLLQIGPIREPNFPWVVLDRALLYHEAVAGRAHARRDPLKIETGEGREGPTSKLESSARRRLQDCFERLRKHKDPLTIEHAREDLARIVEEMI